MQGSKTQLQTNKDREVQGVLAANLNALRLRNPAYSLRAFARKLGMPASALSEILQGKRGISKKAAVKIADALMLSPLEKARLLLHFPEHATRSKSSTIKIKASNQLKMDHFRTISEWYHFAILSLAETASFKPEATWIAKRLGLTKAIVSAAVQRLLRLDMIHPVAEGFVPTGLSYTTPDEIAEISLRKAHSTNLGLAQRSLERDSIELRDFTSMTMAIDPMKIPEAKKRIRNFQKELCAFLESDEKLEVYKICLQFFPLSQNGEESES